MIPFEPRRIPQSEEEIAKFSFIVLDFKKLDQYQREVVFDTNILKVRFTSNDAYQDLSANESAYWVVHFQTKYVEALRRIGERHRILNLINDRTKDGTLGFLANEDPTYEELRENIGHLNHLVEVIKKCVT